MGTTVGIQDPMHNAAFYNIAYRKNKCRLHAAGLVYRVDLTINITGKKQIVTLEPVMASLDSTISI